MPYLRGGRRGRWQKTILFPLFFFGTLPLVRYYSRTPNISWLEILWDITPEPHGCKFCEISFQNHNISWLRIMWGIVLFAILPSHLVVFLLFCLLYFFPFLFCLFSFLFFALLSIFKVVRLLGRKVVRLKGCKIVRL